MNCKDIHLTYTILEDCDVVSITRRYETSTKEHHVASVDVIMLGEQPGDETMYSLKWYIVCLLCSPSIVWRLMSFSLICPMIKLLD
jgi:hypothetical protein